MENYKPLINKIKRHRLIRHIVIIASLIFVLVFFTGGHLTVMGEDVFRGLDLPIPAVVGLILAILIVAFFWWCAYLYEIGKCLTVECDPAKHFILWQFFIQNKNTLKKDVLKTEMWTAYYLGDFKTCIEKATELAELSEAHRILGLTYVCVASYDMGDEASFRSSMEKLTSAGKGLTGKKLERYERELIGLRRIEALLDGNTALALELLEKTPPSPKVNLHTAFREYRKGQTYFAAGQINDAVCAFMNAKKLSGKTFIGPKCNEYLAQIQ